MKLKKITYIISICLLSLLLASMLLFWASHQTTPHYNDWWIMGKTRQQVQQRYGDFDYQTGYNLKNVGDPLYYYIVFDDNGKACDIIVRMRDEG